MSFKTYKRKGSVEARPWTQEDESRWREGSRQVSISAPDAILQTRVGGMVARNPDNHLDQWYINAGFFEKNYESGEA